MRNTPTRYVYDPTFARDYPRQAPPSGFPESSRQPSSWPLAITTARERTIAPPDAGMTWRRVAWCLLVAAALVAGMAGVAVLARWVGERE